MLPEKKSAASCAAAVSSNAMEALAIVLKQYVLLVQMIPTALREKVVTESSALQWGYVLRGRTRSAMMSILLLLARKTNVLSAVPRLVAVPRMNLIRPRQQFVVRPAVAVLV
uniref:Uncharacterized protein n=1 Tax=Compsopogon caeruleus TaxID=31354 RepID=A0A7S1XDL5_9RHOD|mmetsp:Transcript_16030/g.32254  ORF Transcript_16030/g.32254 Transcript_16030/m.32254 type:complete len:112 (+) Transcript_16030:241-576(+)